MTGEFLIFKKNEGTIKRRKEGRKVSFDRLSHPNKKSVTDKLLLFRCQPLLGGRFDGTRTPKEWAFNDGQHNKSQREETSRVLGRSHKTYTCGARLRNQR